MAAAPDDASASISEGTRRCIIVMAAIACGRTARVHRDADGGCACTCRPVSTARWSAIASVCSRDYRGSIGQSTSRLKGTTSEGAESSCSRCEPRCNSRNFAWMSRGWRLTRSRNRSPANSNIGVGDVECDVARRSLTSMRAGPASCEIMRPRPWAGELGFMRCSSIA